MIGLVFDHEGEVRPSAIISSMMLSGTGVGRKSRVVWRDAKKSESSFGFIGIT
jgi:hypothetical protein